jgi:hypothetical protein
MVPSFLSVAPDLAELRTLRDTLENTLTHLTRTQRELEEVILQDPTDKECRDALAENKPIIARYFTRLKQIQRLILSLTAHQGGKKGLVFVPEEEWTAADEIAARLALRDDENIAGAEARAEAEALEIAERAAEAAAAALARAEEESIRRAQEGLTSGTYKRAPTAAEKEAEMAAQFRARFGAGAGAGAGGTGKGGAGEGEAGGEDDESGGLTL